MVQKSTGSHSNKVAILFKLKSSGQPGYDKFLQMLALNINRGKLYGFVFKESRLIASKANPILCTKSKSQALVEKKRKVVTNKAFEKKEEQEEET